MAVFNSICIVDDDDLFIFLSKSIMEDEGFAEHIHTFEDGREALDYLRSLGEGDLPEILFLDINMPMLDGWEIMDAITELNIEEKMKIYITSSSINPIDLKKAEQNPAIKGFLTKPLDPNKLKTIMNS